MSESKLMESNDTELVERIDQLLAEKKLDPEAGMRLMLVTQTKLLKRMRRVEVLAEGNSDYIRTYPSITWLWAKRRKSTILLIVVVFLLLYFVLTPIAISDVRYAILEGLGLPGDLGVGP